MNSCLEPYNVAVKKYENLLVVDGCITNENKSHYVKLTRSILNMDETTVAETGAKVEISCNDGKREVLREVEPGFYKTDSINFVVKVGNRYKLSICTSNGKKYYSDECEILEPTIINNIHYNKKSTIDVSGEQIEGVGFSLDGKAPKDAYLRWTYEEDWLFILPYPTRGFFDENKCYVAFEDDYYKCWKKTKSHDIIIQSFQNQNSQDIKGKDICVIPSDYTDRFYVKYSMKINQLSISKMEYEFWTKLQESSEEVGDIFGTQPFSITGNIKSEMDDKEPVLGYFQAGSVTTKRIFLDYKDANRLNLSLIPTQNQLDCTLDSVLVGDYGLKTLYSIYKEYVINGDYTLYGKYESRAEDGILEGLMLGQRVCTDCSLKGSSTKPLLWED